MGHQSKEKSAKGNLPQMLNFFRNFEFDLKCAKIQTYLQGYIRRVREAKDLGPTIFEDLF